MMINSDWMIRFNIEMTRRFGIDAIDLGLDSADFERAMASYPDPVEYADHLGEKYDLFDL